MTTETPHRRRLAEIVGERLDALVWSQAAQIVDQHDTGQITQLEAEAWREALARWRETVVDERLAFEGVVDRDRHGRIRPRTFALQPWLRDRHGRMAELGTPIRVRELCDAEGRPLDAAADARDLLTAAGWLTPDVPDDASTLDPDDPTAPREDSPDA